MKPGQVRRRDGALAQDAELDQRLLHTLLDQHEHHEQGEAAADRRDVGRRPPAPLAGLRDAEQDPGQRAREHHRADPVHLRVRNRRRGRDEPVGAERGGQREEADPEQPLQVEVVDDHARERQPDAAADAEDRADDAQPAGDLVARERVAHDPEREREDAAGDALQNPPGDQDLDRARQRVDHGAHREQDEHHGQHPALAVEVAELADDRRRDRRRDEEAGQDPGDRVLRRVVLLRERRERRDDQGLGE